MHSVKHVHLAYINCSEEESCPVGLGFAKSLKKIVICS